MTDKEIDNKIERIENYMLGTDSMTQFYDACNIAKQALYELKISNDKLERLCHAIDMADKLGYKMDEGKEEHICVQTGSPCGFPCFDGCPIHKEK